MRSDLFLLCLFSLFCCLFGWFVCLFSLFVNGALSSLHYPTWLCMTYIILINFLICYLYIKNFLGVKTELLPSVSEGWRMVKSETRRDAEIHLEIRARDSLVKSFETRKK